MSWGRPRLAWNLAALLLGLSAGCADDLTQVVLVVQSDLEVPGELSAVRIAVRGPSGQTISEEHPLGPGGLSLPLTKGLRPSGSLEPVRVEVTGLRAGSIEVVQTRVVTPAEGQTRALYVFLSSACRLVACEDGETCVDGACEAEELPELPPWTGVDAGLADGGLDAGSDGGFDGGDAEIDGAVDGGLDAGDGAVDGGADAGDGGPITECVDSSDCDDGVACTVESCLGGVCVFSRRDDLCPASRECQVGVCTATGCSEEDAEDGSDCNDSVFCNGTDTCSAGSCSVHAGDPCSATQVCDDGSGACVGCTTDGDCPDEAYGAWSACDWSDSCVESATRSRSVTSYTCSSNTCVPSVVSEDQVCARNTEGDTCGATTYGDWAACTYSTACANAGTQGRPTTVRVCRSGTCASEAGTPDTQSCARNTDGDTCATTTVGAWGSCEGFVTDCDSTGQQSATQTSYTCASGSCVGGDSTISQSCTRSTDGNTCGGGSADCGFPGTCSSDVCVGAGCVPGRVCVCTGFCGLAGQACP